MMPRAAATAMMSAGSAIAVDANRLTIVRVSMLSSPFGMLAPTHSACGTLGISGRISADNLSAEIRADVGG